MDINKSGYNSFLIGSIVDKQSDKNVMFGGWEL